MERETPMKDDGKCEHGTPDGLVCFECDIRSLKEEVTAMECMADAWREKATKTEARISEAWKCLDALLRAVYQPDKSALSVAHAVNHLKQAFRD